MPPSSEVTVRITADTLQFDAAIARVREQLAGVREQALEATRQEARRWAQGQPEELAEEWRKAKEEFRLQTVATPLFMSGDAEGAFAAMEGERPMDERMSFRVVTVFECRGADAHEPCLYTEQQVRREDERARCGRCGGPLTSLKCIVISEDVVDEDVVRNADGDEVGVVGGG